MQVKRWQQIAAAERELNQYLAKTKTEREKAAHDRKARIQSAETALANFEADIDIHIRRWENSSNVATDWRVLDFESLSSSVGAKLERMEDGSIIASGRNGRGNYDLETFSELERITGIRIEALTDDRLPKMGPGRADDGNFVLSELKFQWADGLSSREVEVAQWNSSAGLEKWTANQQVQLTAQGDAVQLTSSGNDPSTDDRGTVGWKTIPAGD